MFLVGSDAFWFLNFRNISGSLKFVSVLLRCHTEASHWFLNYKSREIFFSLIWINFEKVTTPLLLAWQADLYMHQAPILLSFDWKTLTSSLLNCGTLPWRTIWHELMYMLKWLTVVVHFLGVALRCHGGTVRAISKPGKWQRVMYNGHKRMHGIKFQPVALPNGLVGNMYGPVSTK